MYKVAFLIFAEAGHQMVSRAKKVPCSSDTSGDFDGGL